MSIRERLRAVGASTGSAGVASAGVRETRSGQCGSGQCGRAPTSPNGGTELYCAQLWPRRIKAPVWAAGP